MKKMTFHEYDAMSERISRNPYRCIDWWPEPQELHKKIGKDLKLHIDFLVWLLETNAPPENAEEEKSKRYINKLLRDNLQLYDPKEQ